MSAKEPIYTMKPGRAGSAGSKDLWHEIADRERGRAAERAREPGLLAARQWLSENGYTSAPAPAAGGHTPDAFGVRVTATGQPESVILAVETTATLADDEARRRMAAFSDWAAFSPTRQAILFAPAAELIPAMSSLPKYDRHLTY